MANTYKLVRLQPFVLSMAVGGEQKHNVIDSLSIGVSATAEDDYAAYIDAKIKLPEPDAGAFVEFADIDERWGTEIAERHIADNNWESALDKMIEAKRVQPLQRPFAWQQSEE